MELIFSLKEVMAIGSVCSSVGGLTVWTFINNKNITALWNQKQDKNVCEPVHDSIKKNIEEIKGDVKEILRRNGGKL